MLLCFCLSLVYLLFRVLQAFDKTNFKKQKCDGYGKFCDGYGIQCDVHGIGCDAYGTECDGYGTRKK